MKQCLNGTWQFEKVGEAIWREGVVPGSVCTDLLAHGLMEDPFWRDNEWETLEALKADYIYQTTFKVDKGLLNYKEVQLVCEGIDTMATLTLNGQHLQDVANMHRTFKLDVKEALVEGENTLEVYFKSNWQEATAPHAKDPIHESPDTVDGFTHVRKAHYM